MRHKSGAASGPISPDEASQLFHAGSETSGILIAVSGGPDSVALMGLLARWRGALHQTPVLNVATIDHGLRAAGADEARQVARQAAALGLAHATLVWGGTKPGAGLQQAARHARYGLLEAHAKCVGASHIVTAHTLDDQAETLMMRMAAGSGPAGLAGMQPFVVRDQVVHWRPLLDVPKLRLVASCVDMGLAYVTDPSNTEPRFTRNRFRLIMPVLEAEGLDSKRLSRLAKRMTQANEALEIYAARALGAGWLSDADKISGAALCFTDHGLKDEPSEIQIRAVALGIRLARKQLNATPANEDPIQDDSADHVSLERLEAFVKLLDGALCRAATYKASLAGMIISLDRDHRLIIQLEKVRRRGRIHSVVIPSLGKGGQRT